MRLPIYCDEEPTEEMWRLLQDSSLGGCGSDAQLTCLCGRTHVANGLVEYDGPEELQRLQALAEEHPGSIIFTGSDTVHSQPLYWPGQVSEEFVYGCPCNALTLFMRLVQGNIALVALTARDMAKTAKKEAELLELCATATESAPGASG